MIKTKTDEKEFLREVTFPTMMENNKGKSCQDFMRMFQLQKDRFSGVEIRRNFLEKVVTRLCTFAVTAFRFSRIGDLRYYNSGPGPRSRVPGMMVNGDESCVKILGG